MLLIFFSPFYSVTAAKLVYSILELKWPRGPITLTAAQLRPYKFVTGLLSKLIERSSINV